MVAIRTVVDAYLGVGLIPLAPRSVRAASRVRTDIPEVIQLNRGPTKRSNNDMGLTRRAVSGICITRDLGWP